MTSGADKFVLGLDFGTDSVRALVVRVADGEEIAEAVANYPRWAEQKYCDAARQRFRHHPSDYLESMTKAVRRALEGRPDLADGIVGIGVDTTGSSPIPVSADGRALAQQDEFSEDPDVRPKFPPVIDRAQVGLDARCGR